MPLYEVMLFDEEAPEVRLTDRRARCRRSGGDRAKTLASGALDGGEPRRCRASLPPRPRRGRHRRQHRVESRRSWSVLNPALADDLERIVVWNLRVFRPEGADVDV